MPMHWHVDFHMERFSTYPSHSTRTGYKKPQLGPLESKGIGIGIGLRPQQVAADRYKRRDRRFKGEKDGQVDHRPWTVWQESRTRAFTVAVASSCCILF